MPKNKGKGGKKRRRGKNENDILKRELVEKDGENQAYAQVQKMLGNGRLTAFCFDGKSRLCHIRGKLRKKVWITPGDIILVGLRDYQDEKADVILKYTPDEARILKNAGQLPESTKLNEGEEEDAGGVEFIDSGEHYSEDEVAAQDRNFSLTFIKKKKADKNFKLAGPGYVLRDDSTQSGSSPKHSPPKQSQQAKHSSRPDASTIAQAAERRMAKSAPQSELTPMQKIIKMQAKKELEEEQRKLTEQMKGTKVDDTSLKIPKAEQFSVLYTCELFGEDEALPKSEMLDAIGSCLFEQLQDGEADPLYTTTCIIHTLNKENVKIPALDTIQRYLQNIIDNPNEQKFRRIKLSNKVYQEKVTPCTGAFEFLIATGFRKEESAAENFLVLDSLNIESIEQSLTVLFEGKAIATKLFRDRKVFIIDPNKPLPEIPIPSDFFSRTADEILREQQQRTEALERMTTLRTQKMREMDSIKAAASSTIYKYTLIRVRFPNNYLIQGHSSDSIPYLKKDLEHSAIAL
uniref:Eukaryotic translation initiation factor 4C n=1 Tax=Meloidogyne javanica TaxID=6303 RepID=A0A915M6L1_MELJA